MITIGLDNGVVVHSNIRDLTREMLPELDYPHSTDYYDIGIEIVYWRKNWGLRNEVVNYLSNCSKANEYRGEFIIDTPAQVFDIMKIIISFMNKEKWEKEGDSIWDYEEIIDTLQRDVGNLAIIASFMKNNPDVYLIFYDSY